MAEIVKETLSEALDAWDQTFEANREEFDDYEPEDIAEHERKLRVARCYLEETAFSGVEFWVATITDDDGDLHWSDIIWGDGYGAEDALNEARKAWENHPRGLRLPHSLTIHGPFIQNTAKAERLA